MAQAWLLPEVAPRRQSRPARVVTVGSAGAPLRVACAPGTPNDRALLAARLFGELEVAINGQPVPLGRSRRTRAVLAYLLDRGRPVPRDVLMDVFWPAAAPHAARNSLHVALSAVRKALAQAWPGSVLECHGDVYRLAEGVRLWTDVAAFEVRAAEGEAALVAGRTDDALDHVVAACTLYRGDLLAGDPYLEWAHRRREDLRLLAVTCWERRCQLLLDRGDLDGAVAAALAVLREEPCHEPVTRRLMVSYARLGQPHRALRHYERIVETLGRVFGAAPAPETETLAACIRRRTPV